MNEGDRVRLTYESVQSDSRVERTGDVAWIPPGSGDFVSVDTDEGSHLSVTGRYVTVKQPGSSHGNSRLLGKDPEMEVL